VIAETITAALLVTAVGWHVPYAIPMQRIVGGVEITQAPIWPTHPVESLRLWDTRTAWLNNEWAPGDYHWEALDANIAAAKAHGVKHITLVLWGTPDWAASRLSDDAAPWLGRGSASMPKFMSDWERYVQAVASRYTGQVDAYEIGNEPELRWFWNGTTAELAAMIEAAAVIIKDRDPMATVVAAGPVMSSPVMVGALVPTLWSRLQASRAPIDAVAVHYYPAEVDGTGLIKAYRTAVAEAQHAFGRKVPVWLTEVKFEPSASKRAQVELAAKAADVPRMFWYGEGE